MNPPRWYTVLLRLLPRAFRDRYADEVARVFAERWAETPRGVARVRLAFAGLIDTVTAATREWTTLARAGMETTGTGGVGMEGWMQDLRFGLRSLRRRPGFTAAAVLTLTLGIGATVSIFSVVNGVLLEPLPYPDSDRILVLGRTDTRDGSRSGFIDHPDVRSWQREVPGLRVAGYAGTRPTLTGFGEPEVVYGARVTDGLLGVFGLTPLLGRDLEATDDVHEGPRVVVVSHRFWTTRLGGDRDAVGRTILLGGEAWEVVGVAPEGFDFPDGALLWLPRRHQVDGCGHGCNIMNAVGRLAPGASLEQVQEAMDANSARLAREFPDSHRDARVTFERLLDTQVADVRTALWVLMAAVVMVLLVACANVANLLLVRSADRMGEIALRGTLGASRVRLLRQLLTESLLLATAGGLGGVLLAHWGVAALVELAPAGIPRLSEAGLDGEALAVALAVVLSVALIFGLAPALKMARQPLSAVMGGSRRTRGGRSSALSRRLLLSGEVAFSLMLLLGAGLLFGTLREMRAVDLGFDAEHVERFRVALPDSRYDTQAVIRFFETLEAQLVALPEVDAAGIAFGAPLASGRIHSSVSFPDLEPVDPADRPDAALRPASPGYLAAMSIPLLRGRWISGGDQRGDEAVVVLNQAAAEAFWPGEDPLGKRLELSTSWGFDDDPVRTVVGVVGNARSYSATEDDVPTTYVPNAQFGAGSMYVSIRLRGGARTALPAARRIIGDLDPDLALYDVVRLEEVVEAQLAPTRFYLTLMAAFSVIALVLAAVGLYGVVAYAVSRRTREIGIRVALGAADGKVVSMVVREGMRPALAGVAFGLVGAMVGGRALGSILYGVEPHDPVTVVGVTSILLLVTLAATFLPARRASRVAPALALRSE